MNLDDAGSGYSWEHAACLAAQLPRESRVMRAINPECEWGWEASLLANIEYWTHALVWAQTKDGEKGRNRPKPIRIDDLDNTRKVKQEKALKKKAHVDAILGR